MNSCGLGKILHVLFTQRRKLNLWFYIISKNVDHICTYVHIFWKHPSTFLNNNKQPESSHYPSFFMLPFASSSSGFPICSYDLVRNPAACLGELVRKRKSCSDRAALQADSSRHGFWIIQSGTRHGNSVYAEIPQDRGQTLHLVKNSN